MTPPPILDGKRRALFAGLVSLSLAQAGALAVAAVATRTAFTVLHAGGAMPILPAGALVLAGLMAALCQYGLRLLAEALGQDYARDIRLRLFDHASRSNQEDLDKRRLGYQVLRVTGDLTALKGWPGLGLPRLIQAAALLPAAVLVLAYLHPLYGWVGLGAVLPSLLGLALWYRPLGQAHRDLRQTRARLAADMTERLPIARRLATLGRRNTELRLLDKTATRLSKKARRHRGLAERLKMIPEVSAALAAAAIILLGSATDLPAASVAAALAALALTIRPLRNTMTAGNRAAAFAAAHDKLKAALARPLAQADNRHVWLDPKIPAVEIAPASRPVIRVAAGESATLPPDMMVDVANLLTGTTSGAGCTVKLDGEDVRHLTTKTLRHMVGIVTDRPLILKGSLRRNLTIGLRPRPSDAHICDHLEAAGLAPTLALLGGLDRSLSERGSNLTSTERVMLSCLRVGLQEPGLVLLQSAPPCPMTGVHTTLRSAMI